MEVLQVLHMNKGDGETSYAKNSALQSKLLTMAKTITDEALQKTFGAKGIPESVGIADLGCSSGPNALKVVSEIIDYIYKCCFKLGQPAPDDIRIYLNDLPNNDFNNIFSLLPEFLKKLEEKNHGAQFGSLCFFTGVPGSFYGRLFPKKSLHFAHSSSSLHWLSQVPPRLCSTSKPPLNKGRINLSKTSSLDALEAYLTQFQNDFSVFLKSRAEEIVPNGSMVLSFMGRTSSDPRIEGSCSPWEVLGRALMSMVSDGLVDEEKVDTFNVPFYTPSAEELKAEIEKEGSFIIDCMESFSFDWDAGDNQCNNGVTEWEDADDDDEIPLQNDRLSRGGRVAATVRAATESMLDHHFGKQIVDELFTRLGKIVDNDMSENETRSTNLIISMFRKS